MFGNLINTSDFIHFCRLLLKKSASLSLFSLSGKKRVEKAWDKRTVNIEENWRPLLERMNFLITGDRNVERYEYARKKYLPSGEAVAASLGCGSGEHEFKWHETGGFARIDGFDLSPSRISIANQRSADIGLAECLRFHCQDIGDLAAKPNSYDVVILESSLHHFTPLDKIIALIQTILKPSGLVFMCDFVGPTKFQWLPRQLSVANSVLNILPEKYKRLSNGKIYQKVARPSLMRMYLSDPSEAVESSNILPLMHKGFDTLELSNAGGAILNHILPNLIHNFPLDDKEAQGWLQFCVGVEDRLIERIDEIGQWYVFAVYQAAK